MVEEPTIRCPKCQAEIRITETLAAPLIEATRSQFEQKLADKETQVAEREAKIREQKANLEREHENLQAQIDARLEAERQTIAAQEAEKAKRLVANDLALKSREVTDLQSVLDAQSEKLAEAQKAQADLIRKQRELDDAKREMELTIETKVQESLGQVRDKAKRDAEEGLKLKVSEKEEQIASMQRQIEELKRKAEQGSQQLQGEVQELELEALLRSKFPRDTIEPVAKGELGADVVQHVFNAGGQRCGSIVWELKRTKNWSDGWLSKLRSDQRAAKAEAALLISHALPKGVDSFDFIEGVWVAEPRCAIPVAVALRESLISLAGLRQAGEGQNTKMEMVYQYLTGPRFRHRVEAIVEKFSEMQMDLDRERKAMTRLWAKREEQIRGVIESTAGMYGDLQGIAGKSLQEIEGLEAPLLAGPDDTVEDSSPTKS